MKGQVLLVLGSCLVALVGVELTARAIVKQSDRSAGVLLGRQLPPLRIIPAHPTRRSRESPYADIVIDGNMITVGDLWGYHRDDALLGYTVEENTRSVNGWWQSNNIGARSRTDTKLEIPAGQRRILVFGESYAASTRVRQEETWSNILALLDPRREVVNLGVDGYSMGQAYARYLSLKAVEHDGTLMMFVPSADLWRDVNTIRDLYGSWMPEVLPRFVIDRGNLALAPSPYVESAEIYRDNYRGLSRRLRDHLRQYDRFYFRSLYESPPIIGNLIIYKLVALAVGQLAMEALVRGLMLPGSEAMEVSHAIFLSIQTNETKIGAKFALLILPQEEELDYFKSENFSRKWQAMVAFICKGLAHCIDLAPALRKVKEQDRDVGADGSHYGPIMNRRIGEAVHAELVHQGL
jgi:hypothetical protein